MIRRASRPQSFVLIASAGAAGVLVAVALVASGYLGGSGLRGPVELTGIIGNDAGPAARLEGSNYPHQQARNPKEASYGYGDPGWEPGPDYYSTKQWDNAPIMPSLMNPHFDPLIPPSTMTKPEVHSYMFSVTPKCDGGLNTRNIRKILGLTEWYNSGDFQTAIYKEYSWFGSQMAHFISKSADVVIIVPPCFFPKLANTELEVLNSAIYNLGASIMIIGGLSGADFISQNLAGKDGYGYVDEGGVGMAFSHKFGLDVVFSDGPFFKQNAAATTELFYGPQELPGVRSNTIGIPVKDLPPETIHYYMSADEISIVFEIPAGDGRILFIGYDFIEMVPHWIDMLMLARRELQIEQQYPAGMTVGLDSLSGLKSKGKPGSSLKNVQTLSGTKSSKGALGAKGTKQGKGLPQIDHVIQAIESKAQIKDEVDREIEAKVRALERKEGIKSPSKHHQKDRIDAMLPHLSGKQLRQDAQDMTDRSSWEYPSR